MKNLLLFGTLTILALAYSSCDDGDEPSENVANLEISVDVNGNVANLSATADNANSYSWDFGNGNKDNGASVQATYKIGGTYWVKCTAAGKIDDLTDSIQVEVDGDITFDNTVTRLLSAHPWKWAGNGTQPNDWGLMSCGEKSFTYDHDSAEYAYADLFDDSWWLLGQYDGVVREEALDDVYTFTLDQSLAFTNEYDTTGFMWNWMWAYKTWGEEVDLWGDVALMKGEEVGSWDIQIIPQVSDTLAKTIVNGSEVNELYVIELKGGAYMGIGASTPIYQICRIDADTAWIRYDNSIPSEYLKEEGGITIPEWDGNISGDPEWGYFYLVNANK